MNQVLFRVWESMELLSNQVLDPFPTMELKVNNGVRKRESSCSVFGRAEVRKKRAGCHWRERENVYIPP